MCPPCSSGTFLLGLGERPPVAQVAGGGHSGHKRQQGQDERGVQGVGAPALGGEVTTDQASVYPTLMEELLPAAWHRTDCYANNRVEADHGRLKARLRPMRGLKQERSAWVVIAGHAFIQNVRRGHYELAVEKPPNRRVAIGFDELTMAI